MQRGNAQNEVELRVLINNGFEFILEECCGSFYRKMLRYLVKAANREEILK